MCVYIWNKQQKNNSNKIKKKDKRKNLTDSLYLLIIKNLKIKYKNKNFN